VFVLDYYRQQNRGRGGAVVGARFGPRAEP
jgi:hypothetical protein